MKTPILLAGLALACCATTASAQVPNGGFEDWYTPDGASYQDPVGWITFNGFTSIIPGSPASCEQGTPGAVGASYATVTTRTVTGFGTIPGIIITGDGNTGNSGFPYASRPAALTGQWQYDIHPQDTGMVVVYFSKWNNATQESDSVGGGAAMIMGVQNGWTNLNIPITYFNTDTPDSAFIAVSSSLNAPQAGSFVKVDDLGFGVSTAVEEATATALRLFPSPATDVLNIAAEQRIAEVKVLDMAGRTVLEQGAATAQLQLNVANLHEGQYLVQLIMANGERLVRPFVKQ